MARNTLWRACCNPRAAMTTAFFSPICPKRRNFSRARRRQLYYGRVCSGCPIEDIVSELGAALPGQDIRALRQVVAQRMYSISFAQNMALVVTVVILFSACVMVVMSMLVSVNERRKEIGLLRAVGLQAGGLLHLCCRSSRLSVFWQAWRDTRRDTLRAARLGHADRGCGLSGLFLRGPVRLRTDGASALAVLAAAFRIQGGPRQPGGSAHLAVALGTE